MAASHDPKSLRRKPTKAEAMQPYYVLNHGTLTQVRPMRPGKTAEDKRIGAWKPRRTHSFRED